MVQGFLLFCVFRIDISNFATIRIRMKKNVLLLLSVLMFVLCSCSTSDNITGDVSLSKVSHSDCENHHSSSTRAEGFDPSSCQLRLTYNRTDETISGEYLNYTLCCDYTDAGINIEQDGNGTLVLNPWNDSKGLVNCICHLNIYFSLRNVTMDTFHLILNRRTVIVIDKDGTQHQETWTDYNGIVSFKDKNVVTINL